MNYLLDTNILSELRKPDVRRNAGLMAWLESVDSSALHLSVLVVGEIRKGIERVRSPDPAQAEALDTWLRRIEAAYADRILPVTAVVARRWGRSQGARSYPVIDALLAATADEHELQLVTRNTADLVGWPGVHPPLNPFSS